MTPPMSTPCATQPDYVLTELPAPLATILGQTSCLYVCFINLLELGRKSATLGTFSYPFNVQSAHTDICL